MQVLGGVLKGPSQVVHEPSMWDVVVDARWWARGRGNPRPQPQPQPQPRQHDAMLCFAFAMPIRCWSQNHTQNLSGACTAQPLGGYHTVISLLGRTGRPTGRNSDMYITQPTCCQAHVCMLCNL